jgi:hypothetical protein
MYVFECFQSHFHILEELHEFLCMIDVLTIFWERNFIFKFCKLWIDDKVIWGQGFLFNVG